MALLVQRRHSKLEPLPMVNRRVERLVVKYAELCGAPASGLP